MPSQTDQHGALPTAQSHGFLFAGGGTGGHLYPGLAIAEQLAAILGTPPPVMFLTSSRAIDAKVMTSAGAAFTPIPAAPLSVRPRALLRLLGSWGGSVRAARAQIREMKRRTGRVTLVATGGFVSAPCAQAARAERVPIVLVNLDATPGKANRWVARLAARTFTQMPLTGHDASRSWARGWVLVPPIVRAGALPPGQGDDTSRAKCKHSLGLDPARPVLMITGGSQGAGSINRLVLALIEARGEVLRANGWQVLHQCGGGGPSGERDDEAELIRAYARAGVPAVVRGFEPKLGAWWGAADLALGRAGAGTVAEAWASQTPAVMLPYPYHRDQHQAANAARLVSAGGARLVTDRIDPAATMPAFWDAIGPLLGDAAARGVMRAALRALGPADGANQIARALLGTNAGS